MSRTLIGGLDIETTGLSQTDGHRIIEIAIALHDLDSFERVGSFVTRINPQRPIDSEAEAVHGISFESLVDAPLWGEVAPKVAKVLSACRYVVAHNGQGFDMPFVYGELAREGCALPEVFLIDTMLQARWATADGAVPSLNALCFACGVEYDKAKAHSALYDVEVMMASFFSQVNRGFFTLPVTPYQYAPMPSSKKGKK